MKTAMQFLKDEIESKIIPSSKENGELSEYQYGHNIAYSVVLTLAEYLIEVEKEQSINLIKQTCMFMGASIIDIEISKMEFEDIYNNYYNQNK